MNGIGAAAALGESNTTYRQRFEAARHPPDYRTRFAAIAHLHRIEYDRLLQQVAFVRGRSQMPFSSRIVCPCPDVLSTYTAAL
jgi:hypothetical protein